MIVVDSKNPRGIVWLASYPKSGNTWIRAFLYALYRLGRGDSLETVNLNRMNDFQRSDTDAALYAPFLPGKITEVDRSAIAAARPRVQQAIARDARGLVLVKTHNARIRDRSHPLINAAASTGAIYVLRNPLDVAISFAKFMGVPIDEAITAMETPGFGTNLTESVAYTIFGTWSENVASWTERPEPAVHVVRYEDLLERPRESFAAIARHVRMAPPPEHLDEAIAFCSFDNLRRLERRDGVKDKPSEATEFFRAGRAGQWRDELTATQIERVTARHGVQMRRFGYLPAS